MSETIFLIKDDDGNFFMPYVNGHGILLEPSETDKLINDLKKYRKSHTDNEIVEHNKLVRYNMFNKF